MLGVSSARGWHVGQCRALRPLVPPARACTRDRSVETAYSGVLLCVGRHGPPSTCPINEPYVTSKTHAR